MTSDGWIMMAESWSISAGTFFNSGMRNKRFTEHINQNSTWLDA